LIEIKNALKKALNAGISPDEILKIFEEVVGRDFNDFRS